MLLFFFLLIIMATEVNFNPIPTEEVSCDNDTCAQYICQFLGNNSLPIAYVVLMPMTNNSPCPITKYSTRTNMVTFVTNQKANITQSSVCTNIADCLTQGCQNFKNTPNAFMFAFIGQCY